jgi:hypothetical protein
VSRLNIDLRERMLGKRDLMALKLVAGLPNTWAPDESLWLSVLPCTALGFWGSGTGWNRRHWPGDEGPAGAVGLTCPR